MKAIGLAAAKAEMRHIASSHVVGLAWLRSYLSVTTADFPHCDINAQFTLRYGSIAASQNVDRFKPWKSHSGETGIIMKKPEFFQSLQKLSRCVSFHFGAIFWRQNDIFAPKTDCSARWTAPAHLYLATTTKSHKKSHPRSFWRPILAPKLSEQTSSNGHRSTQLMAESSAFVCVLSSSCGGGQHEHNVS